MLAGFLGRPSGAFEAGGVQDHAGSRPLVFLITRSLVRHEPTSALPSLSF